MGQYCTCQKPYPDPEDANPDEMVQCVICEDWLHNKVHFLTLFNNDIGSFNLSFFGCSSTLEDLSLPMKTIPK